ncbi:hypothetical protein [Actibacterium lipolyticum]|uniref:Sulfotransferase family protein n=1 Tax=Actibacterium lipolyticum TaxID=1524263 RepID=A0A238KK95_9RHOB|nr:hypothetical protein [Actibacterium lipolyticum]SMX42532.1 hypothetical protein COL8621_02001 [Actibacterium lipolyticum]
MPRFILHAGTHKTGTTAVQRFLYARRKELAANGVVYDTGEDIFGGTLRAHHHIAHALANWTDDDRRLLDKYHAKLRKHYDDGKDILISAEAFYRHAAKGCDNPDAARAVYMKRIGAYFEEFAPTPSLVFRRPDGFAESFYKEHIASGPFKGSFEDCITRFSARFRYAEREAEFVATFGSCMVFSFEDQLRRGVLTAFLQDHGLPELTPLESKGQVRSGISVPAALWMAQIKRDQMPDKRELRRRWQFALSDSGAQVFQHEKGASFWSSTQQRDALWDLAVDGFSRPDFWQKPTDPIISYAWSDDQHAQAEAAYQHWRVTKKGSQIFRELVGLAPYDPDTAVPAPIRALGRAVDGVRLILRGES